MNEPEFKATISAIVKQVIKLLQLDKIGIKIKEAISEEYGKGMDEMEIKFDMNFDRNKKNLKLLENYAFDNIKGMTEDLGNKLRQAIQEGVLKQEAISSIKDRVKNAMQIGENRAMLIARTETNRATNYGRLDAADQAEKSGMQLKKWLLITYDNRTSPISKAMGAKYGTPEQVIPLNQNFSVVVNGKLIEGPAPPFHPNDRDRVMFTQV